jgi:transcriptional regulator with XRE-family HTH domain
MTVNPILKIIRAKKLGVLIRDAREKSGKSLDECARAMGLSADELKMVEFGERPLSLPELEILAYYLDIPIDHFWDTEVLNPIGSDRLVDPAEIKQSRQAAIGSLIRNVREKASWSVDELAQKAGISAESLEAYEQAQEPVPLPELETLAMALDSSIGEFEDHQGPVGSWFTNKHNAEEFLALPGELRDFVSKPINRPYLELAVRLSELKVEKLRALAEGLLEITL